MEAGSFPIIKAMGYSDINECWRLDQRCFSDGEAYDKETFRYLLCPLQYHYPAKDGWVTAQEVEVLRQGLAKQGKPGEVHVYPEASHAFFNDSRPEVYRADDARLAWNRMLQFFTKHLR